MDNNQPISDTTRSQLPVVPEPPQSLFCHPLDNTRQAKLDQLLLENTAPPVPTTATAAKPVRSSQGGYSKGKEGGIRKKKIVWQEGNPGRKFLEAPPKASSSAGAQLAGPLTDKGDKRAIPKYNEEGHCMVRVSTDMSFFEVKGKGKGKKGRKGQN